MLLLWSAWFSFFFMWEKFLAKPILHHIRRSWRSGLNLNPKRLSRTFKKGHMIWRQFPYLIACEDLHKVPNPYSVHESIYLIPSGGKEECKTQLHSRRRHVTSRRAAAACHEVSFGTELSNSPEIEFGKLVSEKINPTQTNEITPSVSLLHSKICVLAWTSKQMRETLYLLIDNGVVR